MLLAVELFRALENLRCAGIAHGDLGVDNCVIRISAVPGRPVLWVAQYGAGGWAHKGFALIDLGRVVDTCLFMPG
jgi:hypothetical protein